MNDDVPNQIGKQWEAKRGSKFVPRKKQKENSSLANARGGTGPPTKRRWLFAKTIRRVVNEKKGLLHVCVIESGVLSFTFFFWLLVGLRNIFSLTKGESVSVSKFWHWCEYSNESWAFGGVMVVACIYYLTHFVRCSGRWWVLVKLLQRKACGLMVCVFFLGGRFSCC